MCLSISYLHGQDAFPFEGEVNQLIQKEDYETLDDLYLFVGSSSIRFWPNLKEEYPDHNVINRGFGGSTFQDLINFKEQLIFAYSPCKVFIYEGDNDIANGDTVEEIMKLAKSIAQEIRHRLPDAEVFFISPKPSIARWDKRELYKELNYTMQAWVSFEEGLHFIDVWTPMCDSNGAVLGDLFIGDNLHMNKKGYQIWKDVITPFVEMPSICEVSE